MDKCTPTKQTMLEPKSKQILLPSLVGIREKVWILSGFHHCLPQTTALFIKFMSFQHYITFSKIML